MEISDSSLALDLGPKARLYARAGIPEYWVFDVNEKCLIVHRDPARGLYQSIRTYGEEETVAPMAAPEHLLRVGDVFPPDDEQL